MLNAFSRLISISFRVRFAFFLQVDSFMDLISIEQFWKIILGLLVRQNKQFVTCSCLAETIITQVI